MSAGFLAALRGRLADNPWTAMALRQTAFAASLRAARWPTVVGVAAGSLGVIAMTLVDPWRPPEPLGVRMLFWQLFWLRLVTCVVVPGSAAGILDAARKGKVLDQVVVSGVSPLRCVFGLWPLLLLRVGVVLLTSLPFTAAAVVFGADPMTLVTGYAALFLSANVAIAIALAASVILVENLAIVLTLGLLAAIDIMAVVPDPGWARSFPAAVAELSPLRIVLRGGLPGDLFDTQTHALAGAIRDAPSLFGIELPLAAYPYALWAAAIGIAMVAVVLGPAHRFTAGCDVFGIAPYAARGAKSLTHGFVESWTRRIEMAFFYENRPRWCARWDFLLRQGAGAAVVFFLWGIIASTIRPDHEIRNTDLWLYDAETTAAAFTAAALGAWVLLHAGTKHQIGWRERIGRLEVGREAALAAVFAVLLALSCAIAFARRPAADAERFSTLVPALHFGLAHVFAASRLWGRYSPSAILTALLTIGWAVVHVLAPLAIHSLSREGALPAGLGAVAAISPGGLSRRLVGPIEEISMPARLAIFIAYHGAMAVALAAVLTWRQRIARKGRGRAAAAAAALAAVMALGAGGALRAQDAARDGAPAAEAGREESRSAALRAIVVDECVAGFAGRAFDPSSEFWTVTLRNAGDAPVAGMLAPRGQASGGVRFELAPGDARRLRLIAAAGEADFDVRGDVLLAVDDAARWIDSAGPAIAAPEDPDGERGVLVLESGSTAAARLEAVGVLARAGLVLCPPRFLPETAVPYLGAGVVVLGAGAIAELEAGQKDALDVFVRLGGSIVLFGDPQAAALSGPGVLGDLARPVSVRVAGEGDRALRVVEFDDGDKLRPSEAAGETLHLLSSRRIGPGRIAWMASDAATGLPAGLAQVSDRSSMSAWAELLPRGAFPRIVAPPEAWPPRGEGGRALLWFAVLSLVFLVASAGTFRVRRRGAARSRRFDFKVWAVTVAAFTAIFAATAAVLVRQPGRGEAIECILLSPGSRRAATIARVTVLSAGREHHDVTTRHDGPALALRRPRWDGRRRGMRGGSDDDDIVAGLLKPLPALEPGAGAGRTRRLRGGALGASEALFLGGLDVEPTPAGRVVFDAAADSVSYDVPLPSIVEHAPYSRRGDQLTILILHSDGWRFLEHDVPRDSIRDGRAIGEFSAGLAWGLIGDDVRIRRVSASDVAPALTPGTAALVWRLPADAGPVLIDSPHARFEIEVSEDAAAIASGAGDIVIERDGRRFIDLRRRYVVLETPLVGALPERPAQMGR